MENRLKYNDDDDDMMGMMMATTLSGLDAGTFEIEL